MKLYKMDSAQDTSAILQTTSTTHHNLRQLPYKASSPQPQVHPQTNPHPFIHYGWHSSSHPSEH
jgi:hypothetical protein